MKGHSTIHISTCLVLVLFFSMGGTLLAQPANNTCETATDISSDIGGNVCGDDGGATNDSDDGDETSCYDSDSEVWYSFTGVQSIEVQITSWCGSTYEPNITIYEGSCGGGLTELACDDYAGSAEVVQVGGLDSNSTYYISVDNDQNDCEGSFCFDISTASTGDCYGSAQSISDCGTSFTLDNSNMGQCGYQCCGSSVNSNYDNACGSSTCGPCPDGCDMNGSTENNAFWTFTPTETCDYEVTMDIYDCNNTGAMCSMGVDTCWGIQYGIYGVDTNSGDFDTYYAQDGTGSGEVTITETFTATNGKPVVIMVDGFSGDECKVDVSVSPQNCSGCTLPIEYLSFDGKAKEKGNELEWQTASEAGNSHFLVQKSKDAQTFETFERVEGAGTTSKIQEYEAFDPDPYANITYYRLKQVDLNGDSRFSNIVALRTKADVLSVQSIFPSPTDQDRVNLDLVVPSAGEVEITVYDLMGKKVSKSRSKVVEGQNNLTLDISDLSMGSYTVRVEKEGVVRSGLGHFVKTSKRK